MSDMANTSGVHYTQQQQQPQQQQTNNPFQCKECGLFLNSAESLDVHLQYSHKENLLNKWSTQGGSLKQEENNNAKTTMIKREFPMNNSNSSENSDSVAKSENEYNRTSPEHVYGHPPTPQSNHSSSPYQSHENSAFSPHYHNYQQVKVEQLSPNQQFHSNYPLINEQQSFYPIPQMDSVNQSQAYEQDYPVHPSASLSNSYRYNPYHRPQQAPISSVPISSGQVYPPQPTPSPSPQTCDKCGYVCNSASQLVDHINMAHPPTPAPHLNSYQSNQHYLFGNEGQQMNTVMKTEEQSDILDLDSHQVFSKDDKRNNSNQTSQIPHNVSSLVGNWSQQQTNLQAQLQDRMALNNEQMKRFGQANVLDQKLFQPAQTSSQDFISNGSAPSQRMSPTSSFGGFDHLPSQSTNAVISSSQVPNVPASAPTAPTKSATWKSNEARRPKTYNCTACNKWFTSSGHLKRHYNTTLHKNAVKSSGQPDPASLPISAHHHPARDNANSRDGSTSNSPNGDSRLDDGSNPHMPQYERPAPMPSHLQQPPNGPYDRQPLPNVPPLNTNILQNPTLVSPMLSLNNLTSNGNSPNGEAGPSTMNMESRGLLPLSSNSHTMPPGFSMAQHLMSMEPSQFQMYPNEEAPHVTQDMAISSLNTIGEEFISSSFNRTSQILPSFDEIQSLRFGNRSYDDANVGGGVSVTNPFVFLSESYENAVAIPEDFNKENQFDDNRLTETDSSIYVYPADTLYVLPDSPYLDLANNNNNNVLDTKWLNYSKNQEQEALTIREEIQPDSTVKTTPAKEKPVGEFVCLECDKKFNKACYLTQHNKNSHSGEKPFKCTRCGKRYHDQAAYDIHVEKHGENKPHKCPKCKKRFNHKTDLRRHMFCHAGIKPHYCETCNKGFIRKDHMLKHVETHKRKALMKAGGAPPKGRRR